MQPIQPLSNLQLELLKVFSRPVPDEDLQAIKKLLADYFAQKASSLADDVWEQQGLSESTMTEWRGAAAPASLLLAENALNKGL